MSQPRDVRTTTRPGGARPAEPQPGQAVPRPQANAGLLVIHGVGGHAATTTIRGFMDPFVSRLREEGVLSNASTCKVGNKDTGEFDALRLRYVKDGAERELLVVEGRWDGEYRKEGSGNVSSWVTRSAPAMIFQVLLHHSRWERGVRFWRGLWSLWRSVLSLAVLVLLILAVWQPWDRSLYYFGGLLLVASLVGAAPDVRTAWGEWKKERVAWYKRLGYGAALVGTLIAYQLERGVVLVVTAAGIVVAPVLLLLLRWLANIPFISSNLLDGAVIKLEAGLMLGGFADMQAVVGNEVTAAAIRTRVRQALIELESGVVDGGPITVLAHSGGAVIAWNVLSEPEITERQATHPHVYRLLTAGAALNWAKRGFEGRATDVDRPLVNHDASDENKTLWANVWSAWDPVSHGPCRRKDFDGYRTFPAFNGDPNVMVRNLGAPVLEEHGEYWRNQQEFVPVLAALIDDGLLGPLDWTRHGILANCRLALLSTVVRVRLMVLALPFAALLAGLRGVNFIAPAGPTGNAPGRPFLVEWIGRGLEQVLKGVLGEDRYEPVRAFFEDSPALTGLVVTVVLFLIAFALMDVFVNVCWHRLGRRVAPLTSRVTARPPMWALPFWPTLWLFIPAAGIVPLLFWQLPIARSTFWAICAVHGVLLAADLIWLNRCVRALAKEEHEDVKRAFAAGAGRIRPRAPGV